MIFRSVCSGIEAASVAWHPLGWRADAFSEIENFPSAVLRHRYPDTPNLGDMTQFEGWPDASFDVLVGGTPCQDFSVAGLRAGLDGDRGQLTLVYAQIARRYRPRWMVWENVPGVLSNNNGRDFAEVLGLLSGQRLTIPKGGWQNTGVVEGIDRAYGLAWCVRDAQYVRVDGYARAVPQRRRRVFVVGYLGDWRRAAAVLFEREGLSGHPPPRREAGQGTAPTLSARTKGGGGLGTDFDCDGNLVALNDLGGVSHTLTAKHSATGRYDPNGETFIAFSSKDHGADAMVNLAPTLRAMGHSESHANAGGQLAVAHTLKGGGFDASEDGSGRGTPLVPICFVARQSDVITYGDKAGPLDTDGFSHAVAFDMRGRDGGSQFEGPHDTANIRAASGGSSRSYVVQQWRVRRLTPLECCRLQGFPDDYFDFLYRGKRPADGPIYKALGNSMAIPPMRWIGMRIAMVDAIQKSWEAA